MIEITQVDHIGIRVMDTQRAIDFHKLLGFEVFSQVEYDDVIPIKNNQAVEINLMTNDDDANENKNILLGVGKNTRSTPTWRYELTPSRTRLSVLGNAASASVKVQSPCDGHVSVFIRDPDRKVIELGGRDQDMTALEGVTFYEAGHKHLRD